MLYAEESLTEQEKAQKRQELNQAAQAAAAIQSQPKNPAAEANPWTVTVVSNFGSERNVTFDSRRLSDTYHQETVTGTYTKEHKGLLHFIPSGKYGVTGNIDEFDYSRRNESDYRNFKANPFLTTNLTPTTALKTEYTFKNARFLKRDSVNYLSHEIKGSLSEARLAHWLHTLYTTIEFRDYTDKFLMSATGGVGADKRSDLLDEYGYSAMYFPSNKLVFGVTGAYHIDDSNDNWVNYSDYDGYKVTGFIYAAFNDRLSWVGAAGYDQKWYKAKVISAADPTKIEEDELLYFASYAYYNLTPKTQIVLAYFWDQNFSNDPLLQFTDHMVTVGFSVKL